MKRYQRPLTISGLLWSLPVSILGILLVLFSMAKPRLKGGILLYEGDRGLAHFLLTRRGFTAITLGRVVTTVAPLSLSLWMHEIEHTRQAEFWALSTCLYTCTSRHVTATITIPLKPPPSLWRRSLGPTIPRKPIV